MTNKLLLLAFGWLLLISCTPQNLSGVLQTPTVSLEVKDIPTSISPDIKMSETPQIISTVTVTVTTKKSATPFPEEKSMKAITQDGKWEINILAGYESTIQVTSVDGKTKWVLDKTTLPDISLGQIWDYKTSNDGSSLYFGLGGYNYETFIHHRSPPNYGLYRLNLSDGSVETILKPRIESFGQVTYGYFALSPNETQLIYSWWDKPAIFLRNVATLDELTIFLPDNYKISGPFVWSPNEMSVIFTMWSNAWDYPTDFILVRMDMNDKSMHYLYSDNEKNRFFVPVKWVTDDVVYLADRGSNTWQINPYTAKLQARIQPTP